ncbi:MAG TPA: DNA/RNA nuclease SfsA [Pseudogracilibacillus sp.]|nr:DNA/RNA nuclease SfsA [Pseudogracilibacillus sp.]
MTQENFVYGRLITRENRFIAKVDVKGVEERVHVPNTGRLPQVLHEGVTVQLRKSNNPNRKTKYSLIATKNNDHWVNIDSQLPNKLVYESVKDGTIKEFKHIELLKREVSYGNSRFDLYYERNDQKGFIEVKGVTYVEEGIGMFPDAPTLRGTKHIYELIEAVEAGYEGTILFLIMREDGDSFRPYWEIDKEFSEALVIAEEKGVQILAYKTTYNETIPYVTERAPISLEKQS